MKKLLLAVVLLAGVAGVASADGISISFGDGPRHHHRDYDRSYYRYDHPRDYYHQNYYYTGGYYRNGEWIPRERIVISN